MNPKEPSGNSGTLPPRISVSLDGYGLLRAVSDSFVLKPFPPGEVKYLSMQEHKELLAQAKASARAEVFETLASECVHKDDRLLKEEFLKRANDARGKDA